MRGAGSTASDKPRWRSWNPCRDHVRILPAQFLRREKHLRRRTKFFFDEPQLDTFRNLGQRTVMARNAPVAARNVEPHGIGSLPLRQKLREVRGRVADAWGNRVE